MPKTMVEGLENYRSEIEGPDDRRRFNRHIREAKSALYGAVRTEVEYRQRESSGISRALGQIDHAISSLLSALEVQREAERG